MRKSGLALKMVALVMSTMFCLLCFPSATSAASSNSCTAIWGRSPTVRFRVETGNRWLFSDVIKFKQTKGDAIYERSTGISSNQKTITRFGRYEITAVPQSGEGRQTVRATWNDGSYTLRLAKNTTYLVTVSRNDNFGMGLFYIPLYRFVGWQFEPTWNISITRGIISCN